MKKKRCYHERNSWLLVVSNKIKAYEWCFVCGAFRRLKSFEDGYVSDTKWAVPTGNKNKNPWEKWGKVE